MSSVEPVILHYKKEIEKITGRPEKALKYEDRLLHCVGKLNRLPVTVDHLQSTGVGKTVNSLRKLHGGKKGIHDAAKALIAKWKNMVIEEDDSGTEEAAAVNSQASRLGHSDYTPSQNKPTNHTYSPENTFSRSNDHTKTYSPSKDKQSHSSHHTYSPENVFSSSNDHTNVYSPSKERHSPNGYSPGASNGVDVFCYSPSKKPDEKNDKRVHEKGHSSSSKSKSSKSHSLSSSSQHKKSSHHESNHKSSSHSSKSSSSKSTSKVKHKDDGSDDDNTGLNSTSGTSFADALGPIRVKKSTSSSSSSVPNKKAKLDQTKSSSSSSQEKKASTSKLSSSSSYAPSEKVGKGSAKELLDEVAGPSHLDPLDMDILSTLAKPSPNYRPMHYPVPPEERKARLQAEEDALANIWSNKNKNSRTKVYSGVKGGLNYVPSLYEQCINILKVHLDSLEYTGGIPFDLLKPLLDGASPQQLYNFEHHNPYVIGETEYLWKFHANREFRGEQREEMETWRDMYLRCMDEREAKYKAVTANIQQSLKKSVPVRQTKLAYVDVAKPPRNILRKQIKNGTGKPDVQKMMGKETAEAVVKLPTRPMMERPRVLANWKPKTAPLMQKTLKSIKNTSRYKR